MSGCLICRRIQEIEKRTNPYFIAELSTGYIVSGDHQFFKGYTLFLCKQHKSELHFLENDFKMKFLEEMALVAEAVFEIFQPQVLNYEALGNSQAHLHWHIFPRHVDDPNPNGPIWQIDSSLRYSDNYIATASDRKKHKDSVIEYLTKSNEIKTLSY